MPLGTASPAAPATGARPRTASPASAPVSPVPNTQPANPPSGVPSVPVTQSGYSTVNGQIQPGYVGAAGPNYGIPQPAANNPYTNPYGAWGTTGTPGMAGAGSNADPYITQLLNQFNSWSTNQQAQASNQAALQTGFADAGYQNNLSATQLSSQADLARLIQQQYRDVTLGKQGNDISRLYNDKALGLAGQAYGLAGQQYGLAGENLGLNTAGNQLTRDIQSRANLSDAASRGALSTSGYTQNDRDYLNKQRLADQAAGLQYKGAGLDYQGAGLTYQGAQNSHDEKNANLDLNNAALDSLGKEYGIRAGDIQNQLKAATTKLGLDYASSVQQINQALSSGNAQTAQDAYNFLVQLMALPDTSTPKNTTPPSIIPNIGATVPTPAQSAVSSLPATIGGLTNQALGNSPATNPISQFIGGLAGNPAYDNNMVTGDFNPAGMAQWMAQHGYTPEQIKAVFPIPNPQG